MGVGPVQFSRSVMTKIFLYPENFPAARLDAFLAQSMGLGLRQCRTLIEGGLVLVDGRPLAKGGMVRPGQRVSVAESAAVPAAPHPEVAVLARDDRFAALAKPAGLHSVAGRGQACLETCLTGLGLAGWRLLNRLDLLTSGLVLAAASEDGEAAYKGWQDGGLVCKWYLAVARGTVEAMTLRGRILDDKRRVVRVTGDEDEPLRWTQVCPVRPMDDGTLVLVRILKGRRHQIRAHLAHAGHPLAGDPVYGAGGPGGLFLHHWRVDMPGFSAAWLPAWPGVEAAEAEAVRLAFPES